MRKVIMGLVTAFIAMGLCACGTTEKSMDDMSPEELYLKGYEAFQKTDYEKAAEYFDEVEKQHPYSLWSERAQIMAAYAYYQKNEYDDAILALERFIQLHPGNRNTPYALYLKGLCYYEQMSDASREQSMTENAKDTFREVMARYPNTPYAKDAASKMEMMDNRLAAQEMSIGRYYLKNEDIIPALNRFKVVITDYPHTNQTPEAYYRMCVGYLMLGMTEEAREMGRILTKKYPGDEWTLRSFQLLQKQE